MRNDKVRLTLFYNSLLPFVIRVIVFNLLLIWLFYLVFLHNFPQLPLFFLSIFLILEIFIKYDLERIAPTQTVDQNPKDFLDSFTKPAIQSVLFKSKPSVFLNFILHFSSAKFILQKADANRKDLRPEPIDQNELIKKAFEVAKKLNGKYVTTSDLLTAYLLLTEDKTKLLFNLKLKEVDILNICAWSRVVSQEEYPKDSKVRFVGIGLGEALVWGWTPETKKYTNNLTFAHIQNRALTLGREKEFQMIASTLQKTSNNNVLLVGDMGVGKENLVESLIYESYESMLPKELNHRRFLEIMVGPFVAGAKDRADLETRLQAIIEEVKHSGDVVLYIPEFQNMLGSSSYNIDLSGAILPYLKDGKMPIIATMTKGEYNKYFEKSALNEVFETVMVDEPDPDVALAMLFQKTSDIEKENKVFLSYKAVLEAAKYADKYSTSEGLPGSAVDLLSDAAGVVHSSKGKNAIVTQDDVESQIENKTKIPVGIPKAAEKDLLLNLESEMHKSVIGQDEAVKVISEALRRIRAGISRQKPISFLFLGPTGVGKTQSAKTLANLYFKGEVHIIRLDMSEYGTEESLSRLLSNSSESFLDQVLNHPFSLVLLDEFEKANSKILNLFLQVLDDGRMTDSTGKTVSFTNTIIIATSNAGSEFIRENIGSSIGVKSLINELQTKGIFTPELLNRFDEIVMFKPLSQSQIAEIAKLVLNELTLKLSAQDISLQVDEKALEKIAQGGFDLEFGARPLRRYIQDNLEDVIAKKLLSSEISRGDKVLVSVDQSGDLSVVKS